MNRYVILGDVLDVADQYSDALESLLVVARTPDFERPSAPTPNRALRRYAVVSPDAQPMDLDNATPEEKQLMAAYLAGIRVWIPGLLNRLI